MYPLSSASVTILSNLLHCAGDGKLPFDIYPAIDLIKSRLDRVYAREQARRHREILAQVEAELKLKEQFHIPFRIRKESRLEQ